MVGERREALSRSLDLIAELLPGVEREEIDAALGRTRVRLSVLPEDLLGAHAQAAVYVFASLVVRSGMQVEADGACASALRSAGLQGDDFATTGISDPRMFPAARLHPLRAGLTSSSPSAARRTRSRGGASFRFATGGRMAAVRRAAWRCGAARPPTG